jgi:hypothetical protein
VIEQVNFNRPGRFPQLPGDLNVGRTGRGIAAGVVVLCGEPSYVE